METLSRSQRIELKTTTDDIKRLAYQKKYRDTHKEQESARKRAWYVKNKERLALKHAEYYRNNVDKISDYHKQKYANK